MDNFTKLIAFLLFLFANTVFADTYPTVSLYSHTGPSDSGTDGSALCTRWLPYIGGSTTYAVFALTSGQDSCKFYRVDNYLYYTGFLSKTSTCPSGGTVSGSSCINATACVAPQVRSVTTTQCINNPCSIGSVSQLTQFQASGSQIIYMGRGPALSDGTCDYQCNDALTSEKYNSTGSWATYSCNTNGLQSTGSAPVAIAKPSDSVALVPTASGETCSSKTGKNVCTGGSISSGCSYINGAKTCAISTDAVTVGSSPPLASVSAKNCGRVNGSVVCVQASGVSNNVATVTSPAGSSFLTYEQGVKTVSTTSPTVANPDGSTTQTSTNSTNIYGDSDGVTTVNTSSTGVATTTKTGGATGSGSGGNDAATADASRSAALAECSKPENAGTVLCAKVENSAPANDVLQTKTVSGSLDVGSYDTGSCPADQVVVTSRGTFTLSNAPLCSMVSGVKPFIIALAYLAAGFLVLGSLRAA
jgi:hypothetical protein